MQKLSTAKVATLTWIQSNTAAQIADQLPPDYYPGVGKAAYIAALQRKKGTTNPRACAHRRPRDLPGGPVRLQPDSARHVHRPHQGVHQRVRPEGDTAELSGGDGCG